MEDNRKGGRERFTTLSPIMDTLEGVDLSLNPAFSGKVPADNIGFFPKGTAEVPDKEFRKWPEKE